MELWTNGRFWNMLILWFWRQDWCSDEETFEGRRKFITNIMPILFSGVSRFWGVAGKRIYAGSFLSRFTVSHLIFEVFQTRVAHFCFCLVRITMPLLICRQLRLGPFVCFFPVLGTSLDDRQITHLICVHLKLLLHDFFWGGGLCLLPVVFLYKGAKHPVKKS